MNNLKFLKIIIPLFVIGISACDSSDSSNDNNSLVPARTTITEITVTGEQDGSTKQDFCYDSDLAGPIPGMCTSDVQINSNASYILEFKFYSGDPDNRTDVTQEIINNHENYFIFFTLVSGTERYTFEYFPENTGTLVGLKVRVEDAGVDEVFGPTVNAGLIFSENLDKTNIPLNSRVDSNENIQFVSNLLASADVIARAFTNLPNYPN